eukprot:3282817-Pyramimonas_sp.AAC.1
MHHSCAKVRRDMATPLGRRGNDDGGPTGGAQSITTTVEGDGGGERGNGRAFQECKWRGEK